MKWGQILPVLVLLAMATAGLFLMDLAHRSDPGGLCNGWFCLDPVKAFHVGIYMAFAGAWSLAGLLLWIWSNE